MYRRMCVNTSVQRTVRRLSSVFKRQAHTQYAFSVFLYKTHADSISIFLPAVYFALLPLKPV